MIYNFIITPKKSRYNNVKKVDIYGPGDSFDSVNSHVIPSMIMKVLNAKRNGQKEVMVWGDGSPTREFLYIDDAADAYSDLIGNIVKAAEMEATLKRLLVEIEATKRRVNALEFKVIPEMKEAQSFIQLRLEEMEREETFRLKRFKNK